MTSSHDVLTCRLSRNDSNGNSHAPKETTGFYCSNDSLLVERAMNYILSSPCAFFSPESGPVLRVVSMCSSSPLMYKCIVPQLIDAYKKIHHSEVHVSITHGVPTHKTVSAFGIGRRESNEYTRSFLDESHSNIFSVVSKMTFPTYPPQHHHHHHHHNHHHHQHFEAIEGISPEALSASLPLSPGGSIVSDSSSYVETSDLRELRLEEQSAKHWDPSLSIFNVFTYVPLNSEFLMVPPLSTHYSIDVHTMPTHTLPSFQSIVHARYMELAYNGIMLVCYPTSLHLYNSHVLPCLDLTLLQLLALNMISSQTCENLTTPPVKTTFPSFEEQRRLISSIPNAVILYEAKVDKFEFADWGNRWLSEEFEWIWNALRKSEVNSSQIVLKLVQGLTSNREWAEVGSSEVSVFVVQKRPCQT
jgi:hypothetical protein